MIINDLTTKPKVERVTFNKDTLLDKDGIIEMLSLLDTQLKVANVELAIDVDSSGTYTVYIERKKITRTRRSRSVPQSKLDVFPFKR